MAAKSRESILAELDARKIGYSEEMSYRELCELLKQAQAEDEAEEPKEAAAPLNIDYSGVRVGLSTIQDLHRRLTIVEHRLDEG